MDEIAAHNMAGKRQHYVPRFLQRGFLAERTDDAERTWLHRRGAPARPVVIRDVGVGEFFYSKLAVAGEQTLDDLITAFEGGILADFEALKQAEPGSLIAPETAARIAVHLTLRTAHLRSVFEQGTAQLLEFVGSLSSDPEQVRGLLDLDDAAMSRAMEGIDAELDASPLDHLPPRPLIRRVTAFRLREAFDEVYASQRPMIEQGISQLVQTLPAMMRNSHNHALKNAQTGQWEADLTQLSWRTHAVDDAILPDCIALARDGTESLLPLALKEDKVPHAIILPLSHNRLLVGTRGDPINIQIDEINAAGAACSDRFFIASRSLDSTELSSLIGQRCALAIGKVIDDAIEGLRSGGSERPTVRSDMAAVTQSGEVKGFGFSLSCQSFADAETAERLGRVMQIVLQELSRSLPLSQLDGVTFAADYAAALENLDRGDPELRADNTRPRAYGQAVAKCVHVMRNGVRKEHLVFDARVAHAVLDSEEESRTWSLHVIVSMIANVAHGALYEQHLTTTPGSAVDPVAGRLHIATSITPGRYFSARSSAFADPKAGEGFSGLFSESLLSAQREIRGARQAYLDDGLMDVLLDAALMHLSFVLAHAAEWLGHRDGLPEQHDFPGASLPEELRAQGLQDWIELFGMDLRRLHDVDGQFTAENVLALSRHVERLLWTMGMFPWPMEDGGLYVTLAPLN